jgi:ribosomal protein L11 methyltransferase
VVEEYLTEDGRPQTEDGRPPTADRKTALALSAVGRPLSTVVDLGCGTAILAIAAIQLGVERALGVDIDPEAIQAAQENVAANRVQAQIELAVGSLEEVLAGKFGLRQGGLVLANILAPVLVRLLDEGLAELLEPGGVLVLSGILAEQAGDVQTALEKSGLRLIETRQMGDWVALVAAV